jgi:hypothetical protein
MVRWITWIALTTAMVILAVATEYARSGVEIRLAGRYYAAPATVRMVVAVEPRAANRLLRVEADGDEMFCSTEQPPEGAKEARLHTIEFKNLRAGEYTLRAQVLGGDAVRSEATADIMVTGQDPE